MIAKALDLLNPFYEPVHSLFEHNLRFRFLLTIFEVEYFKTPLIRADPISAGL